MIAGSLQPPAPLRAASLLDGAQLSPTTSEMHGHSPTDVMFRKKEQKDAELDKKIEALRKKNEALMKRYQEVEEDKKRAEEEGMAPLSRKGKAEDLTITINKSASESRVVTKKAGSGDVASARGVQDPADPDVNLFGAGRGRRRQLLVTMSGITKGKRIVSEKRGQTLPPSPGAAGDVDEEEDAERGTMGRPPQPPKPDGGPQEDDGGRQERPGPTEESLWLAECDPYYQETEGPVPQGHTDLTVPTSREEQLEYMRWKKERERIDRERVARHRNAKGQWKRAWDVDKTENMDRGKYSEHVNMEDCELLPVYRQEKCGPQRISNLKSPRSGVSTEGGEATAASWKWYGLMDEAMGARHVITPPVLISSSSPCPPPAVASPPLEVTPPGSNERPGRGEKRQREIEEIWCRMQREKEEEEKEERERERLERQREEEKEARYREEWRAERERERMEHLEERARWEREKAQMLEQWQEERQQAREREDRLMELLQMALRK